MADEPVTGRSDREKPAGKPVVPAEPAAPEVALPGAGLPVPEDLPPGPDTPEPEVSIVTEEFPEVDPVEIALVAAVEACPSPATGIMEGTSLANKPAGETVPPDEHLTGKAAPPADIPARSAAVPAGVGQSPAAEIHGGAVDHGNTGTSPALEEPAGVPGVGAGSEMPGPDQPALEDPVEILVGMAERGEIDPWNINIIEVTDRFLNELERCRQLNLRVSGRTLFYAATLLRMKSEHLAEVDGGGQDEEGDAEFGEDFGTGLDDEFEYEGRLGPIELLEREIQRRLDRKNLRKSPVTLFELIIELKNIEKEERRRRRLATEDQFLPDADDIVSIAHDEGYQDTAVTVYQECLKCMIREEEMTLGELCRKLGWDVPEVYIPLLFLMLDGQCAIRQEEFFGEVYVQVCKADGKSIEKMVEEIG